MHTVAAAAATEAPRATETARAAARGTVVAIEHSETPTEKPTKPRASL